MKTLCRDCFTIAATPARGRCRTCGSPRLVAHPELGDLSIAHIDCDAFYAAIEKRDDPSLRDQPLIIGGGRRGVVATCCYIARTFGVRSAMPMFKARALCPDAVIVRPDMAKYVRIGRDIRTRMLALTPLVEPLSIDEAFLDLSGTAALHKAAPAAALARFCTAIEAEVGITVSIGLSYCKFLAKVASDLDKPRGFAVIGRGDAVEFLRDRSVGLIWGIGKVAQERLARDGLARIGDIQARDETAMLRAYGAEGGRLWRLARGIDARQVNPERDTKSVSAETTFDTDLWTAGDLVPTLYRLCERVASRLKTADLASAGVTLKLKTRDFKLRTRSRSGLPATQLANRLFEPARELLLKELDGTAFRLIGIGAGDLRPATEADRGDLLDTTLQREKVTAAAIDTLRARFGPDAITRGIALGGCPGNGARRPR